MYDNTKYDWELKEFKNNKIEFYRTNTSNTEFSFVMEFKKPNIYWVEFTSIEWDKFISQEIYNTMNWLNTQHIFNIRNLYDLKNCIGIQDTGFNLRYSNRKILKDNKSIEISEHWDFETRLKTQYFFWKRVFSSIEEYNAKCKLESELLLLWRNINIAVIKDNIYTNHYLSSIDKRLELKNTTNWINNKLNKF